MVQPKAPSDSTWAFEPLANIWSDAIDEEDSSTDDADYNIDAGEANHSEILISNLLP
jgi:hypothetical protein